MDFTEADAESLAEKLEAMDLTTGERALLVAVVGAANVEEVEGHGFGFMSILGGFAARADTANMKSQVQKKLDDSAKGQIDKLG